MQGKRFATPTGGPAMCRDGYTQLRASSSSASARRMGNVGRVHASTSRGERYAYPQRVHPCSAVVHPQATNSSPLRRGRVLRGNSTQSSAPGASVHHMLNELVGLSHSIAALLEQEQMSSHMTAPSAAVRQQEATLKAQEIERIVRRVEAHFLDRIQSLETINASLTEEVKKLHEALANQPPHSTVDQRNAKQNAERDLREGLGALDALNNASSNELANRVALGGEDHLQRVLVMEKRQRLRVEEQMQSLTEQHVKVVATLERRLKKQEEQLFDLIAAIDEGYSIRQSKAATYPTHGTERGSSNRLTTPRHLLRQHLVQHQQTQRTLQQYKETLCLDPPFPPEKNGVAANMKYIGSDAVSCTLESIGPSKPLTVHECVNDQLDPHMAASSVSGSQVDFDGRQAMMHSPTLAAQTAPPASGTATLNSVSGIDEITMFLENITRELESLDAQ